MCVWSVFVSLVCRKVMEIQSGKISNLIIALRHHKCYFNALFFSVSSSINDSSVTSWQIWLWVKIPRSNQSYRGQVPSTEGHASISGLNFVVTTETKRYILLHLPQNASSPRCFVFCTCNGRWVNVWDLYLHFFRLKTSIRAARVCYLSCGMGPSFIRSCAGDRCATGNSPTQTRRLNLKWNYSLDGWLLRQAWQQRLKNIDNLPNEILTHHPIFIHCVLIPDFCGIKTGL